MRKAGLALTGLAALSLAGCGGSGGEAAGSSSGSSAPTAAETPRPTGERVAASPPAAGCPSGQQEVFACRSPRPVTVCALNGEVTYRDGPTVLNRTAGRPGMSSYVLTGGPDGAGSGLVAGLRFSEAGEERIVFSAYSGPVSNLREWAGSLVLRDGQIVSRQDCPGGYLNLNAVGGASIQNSGDPRYDRWWEPEPAPAG